MATPWWALAATERWLSEWQSQFLKSSPFLAGILLLMALVLAWFKRRKAASTDDKLSPNDQLAHFRLLYDRGELSAQEFERIQALLGEQVRQGMATTSGPTNTPPAPVPTANPPEAGGPPLQTG
jgi:hypothetical protein